MVITTKTVDLDYNSKKYVTTIKSDPCLNALDFQGLTTRGNMLQYLQDPNNALCSGHPFDEMTMFWQEGFWVVKMTATVFQAEVTK